LVFASLPKESLMSKPAKSPPQPKGQMPPTPACPVRQHKRMAGQP